MMKVCRGYHALIETYVDDCATEAERERLETHVASCADCRLAVREFRRTRALVAGLPAVRPSPQLLPAIAARLREQPVGWLERIWWRISPGDWRLPAAAATALVLCVFVALVVFQGPATVQPPSALQANATFAYAPDGALPSAAPPDDYVTSCVLLHGAFEQDRLFGPVSAVQLASYDR